MNDTKTGVEQIETWSRGWPDESAGVVHYARCPSCGQTHRNGAKELARDGARRCC